MSSAWHFLQAERLLREAEESESRRLDLGYAGPFPSDLTARAHVHALLALAPPEVTASAYGAPSSRTVVVSPDVSRRVYAAASVSVPTVEVPRNPDGSFRPTVVMEQVSRFIENHPGCHIREIENSVNGRSSLLRDALSLLIQEDFVRRDPGPRNSFQHHSIKPFRKDQS